MRLISNSSNGFHRISGFTKQKILDLKEKISDFNSGKINEEEFYKLLNSEFSQDLLRYYDKYLNVLETFFQNYLKDTNTQKKKFEKFCKYCYLKTYIYEELERFGENLLNYKLNCQNTLRFLKSNSFLERCKSYSNELYEKSTAIKTKFTSIVPDDIDKFHNLSEVWIKVNQFKNPIFSLKKVNKLNDWEEIKDLYDAIEQKLSKSSKKKKLWKSEQEINVYFEDIVEFIKKHINLNKTIYFDLLHLLRDNNSLIETKEQEYLNPLEKKEIKKKINKYIGDIIKDLSLERLNSYIQNLKSMNENLNKENKSDILKVESINDKDLSVVLPQISNLYLKLLEKQYQKILNNKKNATELRKLRNEYSNKIVKLTAIINELEETISVFKPILAPFDGILSSIQSIFSNLVLEIDRNKNDFLAYINTLENELEREDLRDFVDKKISEVNNLLDFYQKNTLNMLNQDFPQLEKVKTLIEEYDKKITQIKKEVHEKFLMYKKSDVDEYNFIRKWEENFLSKKEQLNLLLSSFIDKLNENFKDLIERERKVFENLAEISHVDNSDIRLPLNFAISDYLAEKLSDDELRERINEIKTKIEELEIKNKLYKSEQEKLEIILTNRIKLREGITRNKIQCAVCHKEVNLPQDHLIKCPFCGAIYHYLCVADWLDKHNSCPACQNVFLEPNSYMFQNDDSID